MGLCADADVRAKHVSPNENLTSFPLSHHFDTPNPLYTYIQLVSAPCCFFHVAWFRQAEGTEGRVINPRMAIIIVSTRAAALLQEAE